MAANKLKQVEGIELIVKNCMEKLSRYCANTRPAMILILLMGAFSHTRISGSVAGQFYRQDADAHPKIAAVAAMN